MSRIYVGSKNFILDNIKSEFPRNEIIQIFDIEKQIKNFNIFFDNDKIFLFIEPDNDEIKLIDNFINKNIGQSFLYFENESYDGRVSLIQKIKKNNSILNFSYPIGGDFLSFKRHLINYLKKHNLKISSDCIEWLKTNCPIYRCKSKITKKEELYYDLDLLFNEINKISTESDELEIHHFDTSIFKTDDDIFIFIDKILSGDLNHCLNIYEKLKQSMGEQGVLMITLYQIIFLINLVGSKNKSQFNIDNLISKVELRDLLGKYLDDNWNETKFTLKPQNPMRVKIALSKYNIELKKLTDILEILVDTILNLRNNTDTSIPGFLMINKVCNV